MPWRLLALLAVAGFVAVAQHPLESWDHALIVALRAHSGPTQDTLAEFFSCVSGRGEIVMAVMVLAGLLALRRPRDAASLLGVHLGGGVIVRVLKPLFHFSRPHEVAYKVAVHTPYSFPSGHVLMSVCGYGWMAYLLVRRGPREAWRWAVAAGLGALCLGIMWSRLYVGVHYLSDVLGAFLLAVAWLCVCWSSPVLRADWPGSQLGNSVVGSGQ